MAQLCRELGSESDVQVIGVVMLARWGGEKNRDALLGIYRFGCPLFIVENASQLMKDRRFLFFPQVLLVDGSGKVAKSWTGALDTKTSGEILRATRSFSEKSKQ